MNVVLYCLELIVCDLAYEKACVHEHVPSLSRVMRIELYP
jgi:hypothetical protein